MSSIKIEVIGPGCRFCKKLYDLTSDIVKEKGIEDPDYAHELCGISR